MVSLLPAALLVTATACAIPGLSPTGGDRTGSQAEPVPSFEGSYTITIAPADTATCPGASSEMLLEGPATISGTGEQVTVTFGGDLGTALVAFVGTDTLTGGHAASDLTVTARRAAGESSCAAESVVQFNWGFDSSWIGSMTFETVAPDGTCAIAACRDWRRASGQRISE